MAAQVERWLFTVDEYERMGAAGILGEDDRVELIAGEIAKMSPIGSHHAGCVNQFARVVSRQIDDDAILSVQNPIRLGAYAEPQPDLAILRPRADYYAQSHPTAADVMLLIEVADTSLVYDREVKLPLYTAALIPEVWIAEVWIADVASERIERYAEPVEGSYRVVSRAGRGETLASVVLPSLAVQVDAVFG